MVTYSIYEAKTVNIRHYPPLPSNTCTLIRDNDAIKILKDKYFSDITRGSFVSFISSGESAKMPVAVIGNLGSGKSILMYHLCEELYKPAPFYDLRLPKSKICVFLDMTNSDTFLESLRLFVCELNEQTRNKSLDPFHRDVIALEPYEQASKLLDHMYSLLKDHSNWCIVLDNITPKSFSDMRHIFKNYFSIDHHPHDHQSIDEECSLCNDDNNNNNNRNGKIVYVCDADIPMIADVNFYQYNELSKVTAKKLIINQLAIPGVNENDVSCLVDLLCGSPIALIAASYLVKDQLHKKRHITLKEAATTVATTISLLTDRLAKRQAIDINANNLSYIITMTTLAMVYKNYQLPQTTTIPYQLKVPFNVKVEQQQQQQRAILALNATYGRVLELFASFRVGTKIPDTLVANFINKYIAPFEPEEIGQLAQCTFLQNPTSEANAKSILAKYYKEYLDVKLDISEAIFGSKRKFFTQPNEKLNSIVDWIPFLRFQQYFQQKLVSLHPLIHESSKMALKILVENDTSNLKVASEDNNLLLNAPKSKSMFSNILSYIGSPKSHNVDAPSTFGMPKLISVYRYLCFSVFHPETLFKLKVDETAFELAFMSYITNLIDSVTVATPVRYGDSVYYALKEISMIQRVMNVYFNDDSNLSTTTLYRLQYYRCMSKIVELLFELKQPKFVMEILTKDSMIADANIMASGSLNPLALRGGAGGELSNELTQLSISLAQSHILLDRFDAAKPLLDKLWMLIDPSKNIHSNPQLCIRLLYVCCLLYDRMLDYQHDNGEATPHDFVSDILSYMVLVYNYQFQHTLLQNPIYNENEAEFFIDIMLLFSNLCLKYDKASYAMKFVKDADILNRNVLKSGLPSVVSPYDQVINDALIKCYEYQGNQPMINKLKTPTTTATVL